MIAFENVSMSYPTKVGPKVVIDNLSIVFDTRKSIGILGLNGAGKSTLIRLIGGVELPNRGRIRRSVNISFPLGYTGCFAGNMTGRENAAFLARVYGYNVAEVVEFVEAFAELGEYFDEPVRTYSSGMHSRLGFGELSWDILRCVECLREVALNPLWYRSCPELAGRGLASEGRAEGLLRLRARRSSMTRPSEASRQVRYDSNGA